MSTRTAAPSPVEIVAIELRARRMRAETLAAGAGALVRAISRLGTRLAAAFARPASTA